MKPRFRLPFDARRKLGLSTPLRLLLATTAAFWMGTAQAQPTVAAVSRFKSELRFRELFPAPMEGDGVEIGSALRRMDGQTVQLVGHMVRQEPVPGKFILAPGPERFGLDGNELPPAALAVHLHPSESDRTVPYVPGLLAVSGVLQLGEDLEDGGCVFLGSLAARCRCH